MLKRLFLGLSISALTACSTVDVNVNSVRNGHIDKTRTLVFAKKDNSLESEKLRRECAASAAYLKFKVADECYSDSCYFVSVNGDTGPTNSKTSVRYNPYNNSYVHDNYDETQRHMKISVYSDRSLQTPVWQIALDSTGSEPSVLGVAGELCEAGFTVFPSEVTGRRMSINAR